MSDAPRPKKIVTRTPLQRLLRLLVRQWLWAIPFALFFGTIYGPVSWKTYFLTFLMSLVFTYAIGLTMWSMETFVLPNVKAREWEPGRKGGLIVQHVMLYAGSAVLGSFLAGIAIQFWIVPGFMGGARGFLVFAMYTLLFVGLFSAVAYALAFYRNAIDRARSDQELFLARRIQRSFLLSQFPTMPRLEVHAVNVSSKQVSGDFYDVVPNEDHGFLIAVADVSGKGVPAALLTSMLQASLRTQASSVPSVAAILTNINQLVYQLVYRSAEVQQFATFFLARIDERRMELSFSNAGHNYPVVYRAGGERLELKTGGTVLGVLESATFDQERLICVAENAVAVRLLGAAGRVSALAALELGESPPPLVARTR